MPSVTDTPASAAAAFELQTRIVARCATQRSGWTDLARLLYEFNEARGWEALGVESLHVWIADPELGLPRRSYVSELIAIWRELVVERNFRLAEIERMDPSKLAVVVPAIKRGEDVELALVDVEALSRADLREKYRTGSGASTDDAWITCPTCAGKGKVRERA